ncbi:MAG: NAD-dependent epimerase/dehydratase family protein [Planctomycetota bacterium]
MKRAFVTGGGGFLGRRLVELLLQAGWDVVAASRRSYPELETAGARSISVDVGQVDSVRSALRNARPDVVFHVAALTGVWGKRADFERVNVLGTENVVAAARELGVGRLVYTSSPSVCFDGTSHRDAGNELPYAARFLSPYPATKARAEALVLAANDDDFATVALRPHLIFGEGDPHLVPRLIERARSRRLAIVGAGDNVVSLTYVGNAAHAHLDAADALAPGARHAGRAYFLGQAEPVELWAWIAELLRRLELPPVTRHVSPRVAYALGGVLETAWKLLALSGEPPMTRFVAQQLAGDHHYDIGPAQRDFGYVERVDLATATQRTVEAFRA